MSHELRRSNADLPGETHADLEAGSPDVQKVAPAQQDDRAASVQMLALRPTTAAGAATANETMPPGTCRHFRFQLPRADADQLRDLDPQPCPLCDALPHRRSKLNPTPK